MRPTAPRLALGIAVATAFIVVESILAILLRRVAPDEAFGVVYLVGVLVISIGWGFGLAVVTSVVSALAFDYFRNWPPDLVPAGAQNWIAVTVFLAVALLVNTLAAVARSRADEADQRRQEADLGAELAHLMLRSGNTRTAMDRAALHLAQVLGLPFANLELDTIASDQHRCAIPLADGATLLVPTETTTQTLQRLRERVVPTLEALMRATRDREEINHALEESRRDLERFFDLSSDLLCIAGLDGSYRRINPAFEKALGYPIQELMSRPFSDFVHPADRSRSHEALDQLARGQPVAQFEIRFICSDGSERWIEWNTVPDRSELYGAGRDVTERRVAQRIIKASHDELRVLAQQQASLRRVATLVARGADQAEVFAAVAEELSRILGGHSTALCRFESDGGATLIANRAEPRLKWTPVGTHLSLEGDNVATKVFRFGRAARLNSYDNAAGSTAALIRDLGIRSVVGVPIVVEGNLWGAAFVGSTYPEPLPPDTESRIADFTGLVATAIANAQTHAQLTASRARIVAATDDARRRLERDLHDGAQQRLVSLGLALRSAEASASSEPAALKKQISDIVTGLVDVSADLQEISRGIHPILSKGGLGPALKALARRSSVPVDLDLDLKPRVPESTEVAAYYVVAEALTNTAKYACASEVSVRAKTDGATLEVSVRDDGVGGADAAKGSGLTGLRDRVEALGGRMEIKSHPGTGTTLIVEIPLSPP
ncbi:PAS domain-containing protein [Rhodococcus sp. IEGM 1379]|uniref:PAS domain-containing protein n=1 Tax=Rhodococcus sp. IEGM 1379 TaxID=3047086 RepID=UPI0024B763E8|nr:PAS domain-containing protein [Rhodococcus sp. IEGM 1379]MDI9917424.1 PAS domain S-box protein [Rhodococcus sp. IEGM 1379]